jgi:hypothetical protein
MTTGYSCPVCGAESNARNKPFADENAVIGHMSRSTDEDHKGIGFQKAKQLLDVNGDGETSTATAETDTETSQSGGGQNPTMGSGSVSGTDSGQEMDETGDGRHELPCGHETFAWSDVPDSSIKTVDGVDMTIVSCDECDGQWTVTDE